MNSGLASPAGLDRDTRRLVRLLKALRCATTDQERVRALDSNPTTARALELSRPGNDTGRLLRLLLLAGARFEEAAEQLHLTPCVVATFVLDHFDIRDRLDDVSFIFPHVVCSADQRLSGSEAFERVVAYVGGLDALNTLLHLGGRREGTNLEGLANSIARRAESLRELKIHLAEEAVDPTNLKAAPEALRLLESQDRAAAEREEKTPPPTHYEETIAAVLSGIQWGIRGTKNAPVHPRLQPFEGATAELRADEQLRIVAGEDLYDPEEFKNRKLPPPRVNRKAAEQKEVE